ncbi:uncharacterized [Tachysurus ichikawai]
MGRAHRYLLIKLIGLIAYPSTCPHVLSSDWLSSHMGPLLSNGNSIRDSSPLSFPAVPSESHCYQFKWSSSVPEMPTSHTHEKHEPPAAAGKVRRGERQKKTATGNR